VAKIWRYTRRLLKESADDDLSGAAAELAYRFFLALFPFFIFIAATGGYAGDALGVQDPTGKVMTWLGDTLPPEATAVLREQLSGVLDQRAPALLSIGIIGSLWAASSGIGAVMKNMNRAYDVKESRPIWKRYLLAIGLTVLAGTAITAAFIVLVSGQVAGRGIAAELGFEGAAGLLFTLARWPVVIALILTGTAFLYWSAPNTNLPFKWLTPGAALFSVCWLAASYLFGLYVGNFGSYNATYGTLGGIVVLMVWFYITAFILLLGAELNAVIAQEEVPHELARDAAPDSPQARALRGKELVQEKGGRRPLRRFAVIGAEVLVGAFALWKLATRQRARASTQST
jgi:membrane protein